MTVIYFLILLQKIGGVKILQSKDATEYLLLMPLEGFQSLDWGLILHGFSKATVSPAIANLQ